MSQLNGHAFTVAVRAYVELVRLHNVAATVLTTFIGYFVAAGAVAVTSSAALAAAAAALVAAAGYVINDYYDVDTDSIVKPWRPIPSGRVKPPAARRLAYILFLLGLVAAVPLGALVLAFVAVNAVLVHEYSRWIKRSGFPGNLVVALNSAATILLGGLVYPGSQYPRLTLVPAAIAFLLVLAREIIKGIEDYRGDLEACYLTLPVVAGQRRAALAAALLLLAVVAVSVLPLQAGFGAGYMALASIVDALALYSAYKLLSSREGLEKVAARLRSLLKAAFFLGGLAFIAGLA
ncbi:MAG: UbiA family prenyltransferase [Crenarchaeota archaeon]|nr:UbiA family prenyltransferase [Thermoproteota archaeon]